jgi:hypothetical protein
LGRYSKDFKNKKLFGFGLEGEKDPLTNRSEADLLEEIANLSNSTVSKVVREAFLYYAVKNRHLYSKHPKIDHYILANGNGDGDGNNDTMDITITLENPPSILDDWKKWKSYGENCDKKDFFKVLKALKDRKDQLIGIMNQRDLKLDEKPVKYIIDTEATSHYVPTAGN